MLTAWSQHVKNVFTTCLQHGHRMSTTWSQHVHNRASERARCQSPPSIARGAALQRRIETASKPMVGPTRPSEEEAIDSQHPHGHQREARFSSKPRRRHRGSLRHQAPDGGCLACPLREPGECSGPSIPKGSHCHEIRRTFQCASPRTSARAHRATTARSNDTTANTQPWFR